MIINLIDRNSASVIAFLAISPGSRYLRNEIKDKTGLNNVTLDYALAGLLNFKLIKVEGRIYSLNLENHLAKQILEEIKSKFNSLPLKIQIILLDFISSVSKIRGIESIILFGSYAKLIYSEKSDLDIAIIFNNERSKDKAEDKISSIVDKLSSKYKKEIQEHLFVKEDLKHKEDLLIKDIIRNGRVLI